MLMFTVLVEQLQVALSLLGTVGQFLLWILQSGD